MVTLNKCNDKYAQCNSCHGTENVYEALIGKNENCRICIRLCNDCISSLIKQCNDENIPTDDIEEGIHIPGGTFEVEGFKCTVSSYNEKEFMLRVVDTLIPYSLSPIALDKFVKKYGYGVRLKYDGVGADSCTVSIPTKNIIERGGLL